MGIINVIPKDSGMARALAETLGTTVEKLAKEFWWENESPDYSGIDFQAVSLSPEFRDCIYDPFEEFGIDSAYGLCYNAYVVDNGDGKIGAGDLFMRADGHFGNGKLPGFRFVILGEGYEVQHRSAEDGKNSPALTNDDFELLVALHRLEGKPFRPSSFQAALEAICLRHL